MAGTAPCLCRPWSTAPSCGGTGPAAGGSAAGTRRRLPPGGPAVLAADPDLRAHRWGEAPVRPGRPGRPWAGAHARPAAAVLAADGPAPSAADPSVEAPAEEGSAGAASAVVPGAAVSAEAGAAPLAAEAAGAVLAAGGRPAACDDRKHGPDTRVSGPCFYRVLPSVSTRHVPSPPQIHCVARGMACVLISAIHMSGATPTARPWLWRRCPTCAGCWTTR